MRNYFFTIQELIKNPKDVVDLFIRGESSEYSHPFLSLLISSILSIIVLTIGFAPAAFPTFSTDGIPEQEIAQIIGVWISAVDFRAFTQFLPLLLVTLLTPALALSGLFFYRDQLPGFYHNLVLNGWLMSLVVLCQILLIPVWLIAGMSYAEPAYYRYLPFLVTGLVLLRSYSQFFKPDNALMWVRIVSVIACGYAFFVITGGFVNSVAGYMIFAVNRIMEIAL